MAALDFPFPAAFDQLFPTAPGPGTPQWRYDGNKWRLTASSGGAPHDGNLYGMRDGVWVQINIPETPEGVSLFPAGGRLSLVGINTGPNIIYEPYRGSWIRINGKDYPIPPSGITSGANNILINGVSGQNLAINTLYYVYLFDNAGTLAIDFSMTGHATSIASNNVGVEIKSGDNTRTLIGMVYLTAAGTFTSTETNRFVRSWLNPRMETFIVEGVLTTTAVGTWVYGLMIRTILFANDAIYVNGAGGMNVNGNSYLAVQRNNVTRPQASVLGFGAVGVPVSVVMVDTPPEGLNSYRIGIARDGAAASFSGGIVAITLGSG